MSQLNGNYSNRTNASVLGTASPSDMGQIFSYNGNSVRMRKMNGYILVCLTDFAKPFPDKNLSNIVNSRELTDYVARMSEIQNCISTDLLRVTKGGDVTQQGTWAHHRVAIRVAQKLSTDFAIWVDDKIEELLTTGSTSIQSQIPNFNNPAEAARAWADQYEKNQTLALENTQKQILIEQKEEEILIKDEKIKILVPKGDTFDKIMSSEGLVTTNMIAAFLGISAIKLNKLLCEWGVQYKQSGVYFLHIKHRGKDYTKHVPHPYMDNGVQKSREHMYWTEKGRKFVIELYHSKLSA